ncbi:hypothetical protein JW835_00905 [bacterium]|nr:hypothetical protein [bacterium]
MTQRREFFKRFFAELSYLKDEARGRRHFKLSDLWKLDENKFRQLKFRVREGVAVQYSEQDIRAKKKDDDPVFLCDTGTGQESIFRLMQQRLSVGEITERIAVDRDQKQENAFHEVRSFLLFLIKESVCIPANDICYEPDSQSEPDE